MMQMMATYEREHRLRVRSEPSTTSEVVRLMSPGESAPVEEIRDGWARFADGFAQVALLHVTLGEAAPEATEAVTEALEATEPERTAPDDEADALWGMTNPQLYELAEQSGVHVKKGATKKELIAAILGDA